jgi:hypothetical protein
VPKLGARRGRWSAFYVYLLENVAGLPGSITMSVGPQKFETCPTWGAYGYSKSTA